MEEYIKILEEFLETEKKYIKDKEYHKEYNISKEAIQRAKEWAEAIEYLLKQNKDLTETTIRLSKECVELEEENKRLNANLVYRKLQLTESIPISVIQNKIDEIKLRLKDDCIALHEFQRLAKIDVLQELLDLKE